MFFWMMLASLMGVIMFGNLREQTKPQENFVAPVYQAMALSMYQQHVAVQYGYLDIMRLAPETANTYFNAATDGIVPLATVTNNTISGVGLSGAANTVFPYIQGRIPNTYKPQNGTRSYLFCVDKNQAAASVRCNNSAVVKYIVTLRAIPARYDGADKMTALRQVSEATGKSRFVGMLQKDVAPFAGTAATQHQPLGASYYILSSGVAPVNSVYIPNYITCNFPLNDEVTSVLGDNLQSKSYIVALSLVAGLGPGENLAAGSSAEVCPAVKFAGS